MDEVKRMTNPIESKADEVERYLREHPETPRELGVYTSIDYSSDKEVLRHYKKSVEAYLRHGARNEYDYRELAKNLLCIIEKIEGIDSQKKVKRVLDFACGTSDFGLVYAKMGHEVFLCDFPEILDFCEWRLKQYNLGFTRIEVDDNLQSILPKNLDFVVCASSLEHLRHPAEKIKEICECLNEGGFFWYNEFPSFPSNCEYDHLKEAENERKDCLDILQEYMVLINQAPGFLWRKKERVK